MPDPASITLSLEGVSVTVKVGDVVPMMGGGRAFITGVDKDNALIRLTTADERVYWCHADNGLPLSQTRRKSPKLFPAIDIAALAAPVRAVPAGQLITRMPGDGLADSQGGLAEGGEVPAKGLAPPSPLLSDVPVKLVLALAVELRKGRYPTREPYYDDGHRAAREECAAALEALAGGET